MPDHGENGETTVKYCAESPAYEHRCGKRERMDSLFQATAAMTERGLSRTPSPHTGTSTRISAVAGMEVDTT